jgi:YgiT-type zinc finger domain-containing protein
MTGKLEGNKRCPLCGGKLKPATTTVPFLLPKTVVLVKNAPTEICSTCHEPYTTGKVTDQIVNLLMPLRNLQPEVLIVAYPDLQPAVSAVQC